MNGTEQVRTQSEENVFIGSGWVSQVLTHFLGWSSAQARFSFAVVFVSDSTHRERPVSTHAVILHWETPGRQRHLREMSMSEGVRPSSYPS